MAKQVAMGALLQCSFGAAPSSLVVLPLDRVLAEGSPAATIMDHKPMVNIFPFGMCNCPANPTVAAATAAAFGVLTPMPCLPATTAPWVMGAPTVMIGNKPALDDIAQCLCAYGGTINIKNAATRKMLIP
ncbi:DUF4280 domain-containing protein [Chromobacterium haemolyticum]|uniref:DUF4280 domain-containing protein n=1 Tax=Chromobacterium haemolyticum TaxID=394935 RepID=A0A1W0CE08_9NEIS|nr:DUF4280 domain-containing protein [Chromobacterium haemolyticum]OQS32957.1 hypothetical protein B0T45_21005 [Chromobacterium haemolyticum]